MKISELAAGQEACAHLLIGQGADVQGKLRVFEVGDELGVVDGCDSVVDSLHLQLQDGVPDVLWVTLLACHTASLTAVSNLVRPACGSGCWDKGMRRKVGVSWHISGMCIRYRDQPTLRKGPMKHEAAFHISLAHIEAVCRAGICSKLVTRKK